MFKPPTQSPYIISNFERHAVLRRADVQYIFYWDTHPDGHVAVSCILSGKGNNFDSEKAHAFVPDTIERDSARRLWTDLIEKGYHRVS